MWIRIGNDLINLATVKSVGISRGLQNKYVLHFIQDGGQNTGHIPYDREEDALAALEKIHKIVQVAAHFELPASRPDTDTAKQ